MSLLSKLISYHFHIFIESQSSQGVPSLEIILNSFQAQSPALPLPGRGLPPRLHRLPQGLPGGQELRGLHPLPDRQRNVPEGVERFVLLSAQSTISYRADPIPPSWLKGPWSSPRTSSRAPTPSTPSGWGETTWRARTTPSVSWRTAPTPPPSRWGVAQSWSESWPEYFSNWTEMSWLPSSCSMASTSRGLASASTSVAPTAGRTWWTTTWPWRTTLGPWWAAPPTCWSRACSVHQYVLCTSIY